MSARERERERECAYNTTCDLENHVLFAESCLCTNKQLKGHAEFADFKHYSNKLHIVAYSDLYDIIDNIDLCDNRQSFCVYSD